MPSAGSKDLYFEPQPSVVLRVNDRKKAVIERIIPVPALGAIICCEYDHGASVWEAAGAMAIRARLLHGHVMTTVAERMKTATAVANAGLTAVKVEVRSATSASYRLSASALPSN